MNLFVTGATGFIGSAVVAELVRAGHNVTGLARTDDAVAKLEKSGAAAHRGDLTDLDALRAGAAAADGVLHLGFVHDFANFAASIEIDKNAITALAEAVRPGGVLLNTSGSAVLSGMKDATEDTPADPKSPLSFRLPSERIALSAADCGVRSGVVRLPPSVYGSGDHGFIPALIDVAKKAGFAAYLGSGQNQWPSVHRDDAATLYRRAAENMPARSVLHGIANNGTPMRQIAEAIANGLGVEARSIPFEQASAHFGWMANFVPIDNPISSEKTRRLLNWMPTHRPLLDELRDGDYFE